MSRVVRFLLFILWMQPGFAATFGSVTTVVGSASDIVLDESRRRLYLINSNANRVEVYSLTNPIRLTNTIATDSLPLSSAMSPDQRFLYVTSYNSSSLNIIDLNALAVVSRPSLPARPEGIAVGNDGRALITTIGTGPNNSQNTLLVFDPNNNNSVDTVVIVPPAATTPPGTPTAGRAFLSNRSQLASSPDGSYIIGVNIPNNNQRVVFVYEVASATVVRSRVVNNISEVLAISPDGKKFMSGLTLFDTDTLEVIAQQNLANAPYPIQPGTNFNTLQNQGGSVFSPDGSAMYSAFNIAPVANPAVRPNIGQLMVNDPDNLLIKLGYQMPENLAGKMAITGDGNTIYAISESGIVTIPIGSAAQNPIVDLAQTVISLASDQCGVTSDLRSSRIPVNNMGRGRFTATAQVLQLTPTGPGGLGGFGGAGGGQIGGGIVIVLPPTVPGGGTAPGGATLPGGLGQTGTNTAIFQTAPSVRTVQTPDGPALDVGFNAVNSRSLGTTAPTDFLIQSNEAINIPPRLRVFQNSRDAEARADVRPVPVGTSANEALEDIVFDSVRKRIYIANSGLNRLEVFDTVAQVFLNPIKVGQLPRSMALMPDNNTLYVANTGGESISIVDLSAGQEVGKVRFPPLPFNASSALITPSLIAATVRGPLIMMSNGALWSVVGNEAVPRNVSGVIGAATVTAPRTLVATPGGEYAMLLAGNGFVYLYDAVADDFVSGRQVFTAPIQGYFGPVAAGPGGRYFLVNGTVLNPALTPIGSAGSVAVAGRPGQTTTVPRPVSGVAGLTPTTYVRFTQPVRVTANNPLVSDVPVVEVADASTGNPIRSVNTVEGPVSTVTGTARANVSGRSMAVDPAGSTAYLITSSGLSIVPLDAPLPADRPTISPNGIVNIANQKPAIAPGSMVSIFGRNLADSASSSSTPSPTVLGGTCVTINNNPLPLVNTAPAQINAVIPSTLAAGRYSVVVRSIDKKIATANPTTLTVSKYAPAVLVDPNTKQAAIFFDDGSPVTKNNPATRDQRLTMLATGLGALKGTPPATDAVSVFFGDPRIKQSAIVVEQSGPAPGLVGVYQIKLYVPGDHLRGDALDVTVRIGGVDSPIKGPLDPTVAIN